MEGDHDDWHERSAAEYRRLFRAAGSRSAVRTATSNASHFNETERRSKHCCAQAIRSAASSRSRSRKRRSGSSDASSSAWRTRASVRRVGPSRRSRSARAACSKWYSSSSPRAAIASSNSKPCSRAVDHRDRHRVIELDHRARLAREQERIERGDLTPVRLGRGRRRRVQRGDRGLNRVRPGARRAQRRIDARRDLRRSARDPTAIDPAPRAARARPPPTSGSLAARRAAA